MEDFRAEIRAWLTDNCPPSMRTKTPPTEMPYFGKKTQPKNPDARIWMERMAERGWTAPMWPTAYRGGGLSQAESDILQEELQRINARPALTGMGLTMIGPALLEFGTHEQKLEHIPNIVNGNIMWCQGYSEPGAGSDLASLQTRAVDNGDHYIINGQKIWTSGADNADWIFCLVRTDPQAPKHRGITFILFDMSQPGVTVRPIQLISGRSPFCETFFDNVTALKKNVVGEVNQGWTVAKRLLQYERTSIGNIGGSDKKSESLDELAKRYMGENTGRISDPQLRHRIAQHQINGTAYQLSAQRLKEESDSGRAPGAESSMYKYVGTEQNKAKYELMLDIMGIGGLGWSGEGFAADDLETTREWLRSKANSIEGGTSEVQLNILAKRVLGLPD